MGNSVFISIKFRYLLIHLVGLGVAYSVEVDDSTTFPIRLTVIDGDGFPAEVEMYKVGGHYVFKPISSNGTTLLDPELLKSLTTELGDPDPEIEEALEGAFEGKERSRWIEPDENFERRKATETNIDTPLDQVKSPSSHEQSFNQSPLKQTGSTFPPPPLMKKENKSKKKESESEEESPQGRGAVDEDSGRAPFSGDIFTENEPKEFHLFTEPPRNTISPFDKNDNENGHEGANNWKERSDESSQPTSTLPSTQDKGLGLGESSQSQSSQISLSPSSTTPKPRKNVLPNDLTTLSHAQNKGLRNDKPSRSAALPPSFEKLVEGKSQGSAEMLSSEHKNISGSRLQSDFHDATAGIENHPVTSNFLRSVKMRFFTQSPLIITSSQPEIIKVLKGDESKLSNEATNVKRGRQPQPKNLRLGSRARVLGVKRPFVQKDFGTNRNDSEPQGDAANDTFLVKNKDANPSLHTEVKAENQNKNAKPFMPMKPPIVVRRNFKKVIKIITEKVPLSRVKLELQKATKVIKVKFGKRFFTFVFQNKKVMH